MKNLLLMIALVAIVIDSFSQKNNPLNQRGLDFVASIDIISADFNAGKVKAFDQETILSYSKVLPLQHTASVDLAANVVRTIKDPGYRFLDVVNNSSLSDFSKDLLPKLINTERLSIEHFRNSLSNMVQEITSEKISPSEKELLLSLTAISYNIAANSSLGRGANCYFDGPNGTVALNREECITAGAMMGGLLGFSICGPWCALGGAIVGSIAVALS